MKHELENLSKAQLIDIIIEQSELLEQQSRTIENLMNVELEEATSIDVPEEPQRLIKRFEVEVGTCPVCSRKVRGTHPELPRDQCGATAHRVGDIVAAQAFAMHYHGGMTLRKASEAIGIMTGITITQGGLTLKASQLCKREGVLGKVYNGLRGELRESAVVNTDDTGWRTGGKASNLMGFFTPTLAVYQIRDRH